MGQGALLGVAVAPMTSFWTPLALCLLLLAPGTGVAAAEPAITSGCEAGLPLLRSLGPRETGGGPSNWAVVQDPQGLLFFGNEQGVLEFDGSRWRLIPLANGTTVCSLCVDDQGTVWVGAVGDFGRLVRSPEGRLGFVSMAKGLAAEDRSFSDVWKILPTPRGILCSSMERLFLLSPEGAVQVWRPDAGFFKKAFRVRDRLFVWQSGKGLLELRGDTLTLVPGGERFARQSVDAMLPFPGPDGRQVLVGTLGEGFHVLQDGPPRPWPTVVDARLRRDSIYQATWLADGTLAVATLEGGLVLLRGDGRLAGSLGESDGLLDNAVYDLAVDRDSGLWLTSSRGITRIQWPSPLTTFDPRSGLRGSVQDLVRHRGLLYAATRQGLYVLEARKEAGAAIGAGFVRVQGIPGHCWALQPFDDVLLVAGFHGVFEVRGRQANLIRKDSAGAQALCRSGSDPRRVFVGLQNGLASLRRQDGRWRDEGRAPGLRFDVQAMREGPDHAIWLETQVEGLVKVTQAGGPGPWSSLRIDPVGNPPGLAGGPTPSMFLGLGAQISVVTPGAILGWDEAGHRFQPDPRWEGWATEPGQRLAALREDGVGGWWALIVGEDALAARLRIASANPDGRALWSNPRILPQGGGASIFFPDRDGVLWRPEAEGLNRAQSPFQTPATSCSTVLLREVATPDGLLPLRGDQPPRIPFRSSSPRFEFAGPSLADLGDLHFQSRLDGLELGWGPWNRETFRTFSHLREGSYQFRVRARDLLGQVGPESVYAFRVLPPWYRTWAAYGCALALLVGAVWVAFRIRLGILLRRNRDLEARIAAATEELRHLNEEKNFILGLAAHDMRSPLGGILLSAQLLEEDAADDRAQRLAGSIVREAYEMNSFLGRLLDFSAIESGKVDPHPEILALRPILEELAERHQQHAQRKRIAINLDWAGDPGPLEVFADRRFLREVVDNLLSNALKFSPQGTAVRVSAGAAGHEVVISVQDQGPGLTLEDRGKLFGRYVRLSASPTAGEKSTGLGLAVVKRLVEAMGGRIWVDSEPGHGAAFRVSLPCPSP